MLEHKLIVHWEDGWLFTEFSPNQSPPVSKQFTVPVITENRAAETSSISAPPETKPVSAPEEEDLEERDHQHMLRNHYYDRDHDTYYRLPYCDN